MNEKIGKREDGTTANDDKENLGSSEDETEDGQNSNTYYDQDSDISFMSETDDEIDTTAIEEEEWIDYMKRSTDEAIEQMKNTNIRCWIKTHKWNPELSSKYKTYRAVGRPRRRWEDEINEFLKLEEAETTKGNDMKYNSAWITVAKDRGR